MEAHGLAVGRLVEGIVAQEVLSYRDRCGIRALLFEERHQAL